MRRRTLLAHGFALTPLAALMLSACGDDGDWAEGMLPIKWDRDTCLHCMMVISDRRFAVEIRGGHRNDAFKFDDIGCAATWRVEKMNQYPWLAQTDFGFWVADYATHGKKWLNALNAHYVNGPTSPMAYNYSATAELQAGSVDYETMAKKTSSFWPAGCTPGKAEAPNLPHTTSSQKI